MLEREISVLHTQTNINWETGPTSPVGPTIPNGKGATNQGPDRVGIPLVVDPIFGASTYLALEGGPRTVNGKQI